MENRVRVSGWGYRLGLKLFGLGGVRTKESTTLEAHLNGARFKGSIGKSNRIPTRGDSHYLRIGELLMGVDSRDALAPAHMSVEIGGATLACSTTRDVCTVRVEKTGGKLDVVPSQRSGQEIHIQF